MFTVLVFVIGLLYMFRLVTTLQSEIQKLKSKLDKKITNVKLSTDKYIFQLQDDLTNLLPQISLLDNAIFPRAHYRVHDTLGVKYDEKTNLVYDYYLDNFVIGKIVDSYFKILDKEIMNECKECGFDFIDVHNDKTESEIRVIKNMYNKQCTWFLKYIIFFGINEFGELYHRPTGFILRPHSGTQDPEIIGRRNKYDSLIPFSIHDIVIFSTWINAGSDKGMHILLFNHDENLINLKYSEYLKNKNE